MPVDKHHVTQCIVLSDTRRCATRYYPQSVMEVSRLKGVSLYRRDHCQGTTVGTGGEALICLPILRPLSGFVSKAVTLLFCLSMHVPCACSSPALDYARAGPCKEVRV